MAIEARTEVGDIPLIEEQVETGLADFLDGYRSEFAAGAGKKDELAKRFTLHPSKPIAELSHEFAKAYVAEDSFNPARSVFAMVLDSQVPCRQHLTGELMAFSHPHLVQLLGSGSVFCSHLGESRLVLFFERPQGKLLSEAMKETPRLHEHLVIDYVLGPAVRALSALRDKKCTHGNIGPGSFFMGETPVINECISAPCGTLASHIYLPPELMIADPLGRGEADERADVYALAILALDLIYGIDRLKSMLREDLIRLILTKGTYQAYVAGREVTDNFQDLLRGTLTDNPVDRWGLEELGQWLGGKRFNIITPTVSKDAARPFVFGGDNYFNPRSLAHALHRQWRTAIKDLRGSRLERWCETNLHRPEIAEKIDRTFRSASEGASETQSGDMVTRVIAALDPLGPIRSISLAVRPDGIGPLLARFMAENANSEQAQLINFMETDISSYWVDLVTGGRERDYSPTIWRLQKCRQTMKQKALGFGIERVLYELNPSLSCQSALLRKHYVADAPEALTALDAIARETAPDTSFADRHLAAYLASKLGINKELLLTDLAAVPALSKNEELIVLRILARAQQKQPALKLPGLCAWAAMRIERMLDTMHNRVVRKKLKLQLRKYAESGRLDVLLDRIVNRDVTVRDYDGFARAIALHQINSKKIERYQNPWLVDYYARDIGGKFSMILGYIVLTITGYIVLTDVLGI